MKNLIANRLNVSADAPDEAFVRGVNAVCDERDTLKTENTTLKNRQTELETENQTLLGEQCDALMDAHGIKKDDKVRERLRPVLATMKNREDRVAALIDFGFKAVEAAKPGTGRTQTQLHNRDTQPPRTTASGLPASEQTPEEQQATAVKIKNRAQELKGAAPTRTFESCWSQAKSEITSGSK